MPKDFMKELLKEWPNPAAHALARYEYFTDVEWRVKILDEFGIDKQVVTLARPDIWMGMPPTLAVKLMRVANDAMAAIMEKEERLIATGTIPVITDESPDEVRRCMEELGLKGVQIFTNMEGEPIDSPKCMPLYDAIAKYDVPIWLHPQVWPHHPWTKEYSLDRALGWPFETSLAMARLVFAGLFDRHPNIKIVVHHMGAMIPFMDERVEGFYGAREMYPWGRWVELKRRVSDYLKMFYADTVILCSSIHGFLCGYEFFGPDHLLFGTDFPFGPQQGRLWMRRALNLLKYAPIKEEDKIKILEKNARSLLKI